MKPNLKLKRKKTRMLAHVEAMRLMKKAKTIHPKAYSLWASRNRVDKELTMYR